MPQDPPNTFLEFLYQLISDADLSIGFLKGSGLGAVLLAFVTIVLIVSPSFKKASLVSLVKAWGEKG